MRKRRTPSTPTPPSPSPSAPPAAPPPSDDVQLPHERDTAAGAVADEVPDVMRRARADLDAGLVDTDLRNAGGADAARRDALLERERSHKGG